MLYDIVYTEKDFLAFLLFTASKSQTIRNKRLKSWLLTPLMAFVTCFIFYYRHVFSLAYSFLLIGITSLFVFPLYTRWQYRNYYRKYVREHYRKLIGTHSKIGFKEGLLVTHNTTGEARIKLTEIEEVNETRGHLFIRLKTGESVIFPKDNSQAPGFIAELEVITRELSIKRTKS